MSTDEGNYAMDALEMLNAMRNLATGLRAFYDELIKEGFTPEESMKLALEWIRGMAGSGRKE